MILKSMDFIHYTTNFVGPLCVNEQFNFIKMIEERSTVFYMRLVVATCMARSLDGQQNFEHDF